MRFYQVLWADRQKMLGYNWANTLEIPSNWEWCRVRNVSNSYIGLTYKPTDIDEKGTIVLRSCNIRNGKLAFDDIVRVSSSISEKLLIEENDIIICARNGSKRLVGKSALIRNLSEPMTFGAFMAICKTPIYEYMFAYLQSDLFFGQLRDVSNTTTINQLTQNKFNDFLIPIPPIREQERIALKISQLFQKLRWQPYLLDYSFLLLKWRNANYKTIEKLLVEVWNSSSFLWIAQSFFVKLYKCQNIRFIQWRTYP